jgi:hypothetical protein
MLMSLELAARTRTAAQTSVLMTMMVALSTNFDKLYFASFPQDGSSISVASERLRDNNISYRSFEPQSLGETEVVRGRKKK